MDVCILNAGMSFYIDNLTGKYFLQFCPAACHRGRVIEIAANTLTDQTSLRMTLRDATMGAHDRLDQSMRSAAGWHSRADYARFLGLQYQSRLSVEAWLVKHAPASLGAPAQTPLIARDLIALGGALPLARARFSLRSGTAPVSPSHAMGVAWVLAGSALGNRAILKDLDKTGREDWPRTFLGDPKMLAFWKCLRPQLERAADAQVVADASEAALAVFEHFQIHVTKSDHQLEPAKVFAE